MTDLVKRKSKILINSLKLDRVKGFQDFTGEEAKKRARIKRIIEDAFALYGFEPAETPIIESESFVRGDNTNDEAVSDVFTLKDRGKRKLALRYEFTFQLKRIAKNKKLPYKRYQIGPVFRDEPTSANRFKQFTQCDCDVVGSSVKDEADVLNLTKEIFDKLGIKTGIFVNNRKLLNEIMDEQGVSNKSAVIREIDKLDKLSEKEIRANLKKYKAEKILGIFKKPESYFKRYESYKKIAELKKLVKGIKFSPSLARGLSYYNGTIVEVKSKGKESICAGGAYMINGIQSFGISFGVERVSAFTKLEAENDTVIVISINQDKQATKLASDLRKQGIPCSVFYGKVGKALEYGNSLELPYAVFVGADEIKAKKFTLRDLKSGKEKKLGMSGLVKTLS
jgi:histidyl-tRNA synthetase